eukprot:gene411-6824_t
MKLQIVLLFTLCLIIFAFSNMKEVESECPYFKKHGKDQGCPCQMSKEDLEKCPHLKKMKEQHGDKPGCPYKGNMKACPHTKGKGCPCKQKGSCPHAKTGGCPHAHKKEGGCPYAEPLKKTKGCPFFEKHGKSCPCTMTTEELEKCPHLKKIKEEHGDKAGCPYKDILDGEKVKDCPYLKNHGNDKECPCKKMKSVGGCPHMNKLNEKNKDEL